MKKLFSGKSLASIAAASLTVIAGGIFSVQAETAISDSVVALNDVQPEYPASAMRREASGYVIVQFDVRANGKASNVRVIESQPAHLFDGAAIRAVRKSEFEITSDENEVRDVQRMYRFAHEATLPDVSLSMN